METKRGKRNLIKKAPPKSNPKKLSLYFVIVNKGQGDAVVKLFASRFKTSLTYLHKGEGTATDKVSEILGFNDNRKDVVISVIKREQLKDIKEEIESFFAIHKRNKGVAFSVPLDSVVGTNTYHFLANDI